jgi:hypothetical protein
MMNQENIRQSINKNFKHTTTCGHESETKHNLEICFMMLLTDKDKQVLQP